MTQSNIQSFEGLNCWKNAREVRLFIAHKIVRNLPESEKYGMISQILRAARSTTANIAEGYGRFHYADNAKFCSNARGSCYEVLDHLITCHDECFIEKELLDEGRNLIIDAIKTINGYMRYLKESANKDHSRT